MTGPNAQAPLDLWKRERNTVASFLGEAEELSACSVVLVVAVAASMHEPRCLWLRAANSLLNGEIPVGTDATEPNMVLQNQLLEDQTEEVFRKLGPIIFLSLGTSHGGGCTCIYAESLRVSILRRK